MRTNLKPILATLTILLIALAFLGFTVPISNASAANASSYKVRGISTNCAYPTFPRGHRPALNSTFTLTVISASGASMTYNQTSILYLPACVSYGGFVAHASGDYLPDDYGNYTGVPVSYLVTLAGGMTPGQNVIATSGTDLYKTTYNYTEVMKGTGWGYIFNTTICSTPNVCSKTSAAVGTSPPIPMYLVIAYLWNGSNIGAYSCVGVPTPCPTATSSELTSGTGPLRTVTLNSSPGYLIQRGAPWNKAVATIQITPFTNYQTCPSSLVPNRGGADLRGADLEYCNLGGYNLAGDNLEGANMQYTNLTGANLLGADLRGADLANSIAQGANFKQADLQHASLQDVVLTGDNFVGADLQGANLAFAYAPNTNFQGDNLQGASLVSGVFNYANFEWANLSYSNLSYGKFEYANFTGANTCHAILRGADFTGAINPPSYCHRICTG